MSSERFEDARRRLTPGVEKAIRDAIGSGAFPRPLLEGLSRASLDQMASGAPLESMGTAAPVAALEAIVQRFGRPPLLVRGGKVVLEPLPDFPPGTDAKIKGVEKWIPSAGRIEFRNHDMSWGGSGFVAERSGGGAVVVTNRHVAQLVAKRKAGGTAVFMRSPSGARYGAAIDFLEEVDMVGDDSRTAEISSIDYLADDISADVALLRITAADFLLPTPFELSDAVLEKDHLVALIGYPAYDSRNDADDQARYFRDLYDVKRFAPGLVLQGPSNGELTYDCTSLGGASGSPVIDLETGKVVGLHFSGLYGKYNAAVSAATLKALLQGERPVSHQIAAGAITEARDGAHSAQDLAGRQGFSTTFLKDGAVATPWPGLPEHLAGGLAKPSDDPSEPFELRYTHFGVKYSGEKKLPLITAVNIDGARSIRIKRGDDKWFSDGRIPAAVQLTSAQFSDAEIDRGHMVRREDPNWSADGELAEARQADSDTFHYTNACAQHSTLNQGKALWLGLENYILGSARTHGFKACVFTGPVLRAQDDEDDEISIDGAIVPREFWKLVVTLDEAGERMHATAYLLSQGQLIRKLLEKRARTEGLEGFVLGEYRTFQLSIANLASATGYDLTAYEEADPLLQRQEVREALERDEMLGFALEEMADVRL